MLKRKQLESWNRRTVMWEPNSVDKTELMQKQLSEHFPDITISLIEYNGVQYEYTNSPGYDYLNELYSCFKEVYISIDDYKFCLAQGYKEPNETHQEFKLPFEEDIVSIIDNYMTESEEFLNTVENDMCNQDMSGYTDTEWKSVLAEDLQKIKEIVRKDTSEILDVVSTF